MITQSTIIVSIVLRVNPIFLEDLHIWRSPSLSELTPYSISLGLTHLGSEASIYHKIHLFTKKLSLFSSSTSNLSSYRQLSLLFVGYKYAFLEMKILEKKTLNCIRTRTMEQSNHKSSTLTTKGSVNCRNWCDAFDKICVVLELQEHNVNLFLTHQVHHSKLLTLDTKCVIFSIYVELSKLYTHSEKVQ